MDVIRTARELSDAMDAARAAGHAVGFVPTMGFFHAGHLALMEAARARSDLVAMSIFVNPLQFGPAEDFSSYPRDEDRDLALAREQGVDVAFVPSVEEMYPDGAPETTVDPGPIGDRLEGASRPGHFRGVCTVLARLFHMVGPCRAYLGQKDAQQVAVVRRMVRDLGFPVEIDVQPTIREHDGLALSSRNTYLSPEERAAAVCVPQALQAAVDLCASSERRADPLRDAIRARIADEPLAELDYEAIVDDASFEEARGELSRAARALIAVRVGRTRLIDNMALPVRQN